MPSPQVERAATWLLELKTPKPPVFERGSLRYKPCVLCSLYWHRYVLAGRLGDRSEGRWWSVCLGICMGTAGDRTCPPVPPDTLEALAGADMACRRFECDIGFQCKTWSLSNLNICLHLFISYLFVIAYR